MGKIKFAAKKPNVYVLDVMVPTEDGKTIKNRDNDPEYQLKAQLIYLTPAQQQKFLKSRATHSFGNISSYVSESEFDHEGCARLAVEKFFGLEDQGIEDGNDLADHANHPLVADCIKDIFLKAMNLKGIMNADNKAENDKEPEEEETQKS